MASTKIPVQSSVLEEHGVGKLTKFMHARKRTQMYLGSKDVMTANMLLFTPDGYEYREITWVPALVTAFREIVDNSLDEFVKGSISRPVLKVDYNPETLEFVISDNGRGIPIDYVPEYNSHVCTMVMSETETGRNFSDDDREGVSGQNGLGGSIVAMTSTYFEFDIIRTGKPYPEAGGDNRGQFHFHQRFEEGSEIFPDMIILDPVIKSVSNQRTGTTIKFQLSPEVFPERVLPIELVYSILKQISAFTRYKIVLNGETIQLKPTAEKTLFGNQKLFTLDVSNEESDFQSKFIVVPSAFPADSDIEKITAGLVNNVPIFEGGVHMDAFSKDFPLGVVKAIKETTRKKLNPNRSDVEKQLLIYSVTTMNAPFFSSQSKTRLVNSSVAAPVTKALTQQYFTDLITSPMGKDWCNDILARCAERTNAKDSDEVARRGASNTAVKIAKLDDATGEHGKTKIDRKDCVLFITEGDCVYEREEIVVLRDDTIELSQLKDVQEHELVLTHTGAFKPIVGKSVKVRDVVEVKAGDLTFKCTATHRILVHHRTEGFMYVMAKDIDTTVHRLVRSQMVDIAAFATIKAIEHYEGDNQKYKLTITLDTGHTIDCSEEHKFGVFDVMDRMYKLLEACEIDPTRHIIPLK